MPYKPTATVYAAYGQTVAGSTRYALDIVLSPPWVQVDVVGDPAAAPPDDRFELRTTDDDTYSQTVTAGGGVASEDRRLLRFVDLVPSRDYALLRHAPGADEPETVFWRRPYDEITNGTHPEADVTPAATFVAAQFVWEGAEAAPLADRRLYLACERRHPAPDADDEDPADLVVEAYAVDGAGRYRRVSVWPDAAAEDAPDAAPPEPPADSGGGAAQDRVLLDLGAGAWWAAVSEAPLSETEVAALWSELLGGPAEGGRRWTPFDPAPRVALPEPFDPALRVRLEPLPTRIYAPLIFGPPRPTPDPLLQVSVEGGVAERARIEVRDGDRLVYAEEHTDRYVTAGEDVWAWDGVGDDGVFDTRRRLRVEVFLHHGGQVTKASQELRTESGPMDWADLRFDRPARRIDVMFHVDVQNEGFADVTFGLNDQPVPLTFGRKIPDAEFRRLKALVLDGISRHWSRTGGQALKERTGPGTYNLYELHTTALERSREPSIDVDVYVNRNPTYARGSNPLVIDTSLFHNEAFFVDLKRRRPRAVSNPRAAADADFAMVAAHEVGHTVLYRTQGLKESITHHGTSTIFQAERDGMVVDDDLMTYPAASNPGSMIVSARDALALCESFYVRVLPDRL